MKIEDNLRQANYPGFCPKIDITSDPASGNLTQNGYTSWRVGGAESVRWTRLFFSPKQDDSSGIIFEAATTTLTCMDDVLPAVA
jgi:hypothetical protein